MNENEQLETQVILIDEDGNEVPFEIVDVIQFEGKDYAILHSEEESEEDKALLFRIEEEDGEDVLYELEDDEEWENVVAYWENLVAEEE